MKIIQPARPLPFLFFFRLFALLGAVPFLVNTVDILLHLTAPSLDPSIDPVRRILMGLVVAPLTLVIAGLCIRRAPANLIGWMLVSFAYGISVQVMRADLLPLGLEVVIGNWFIGLFWFSFLLIPLYFPDGQLYPPAANRWGNPLVSFVIFSSLIIANISNPQLIWGSGTSQQSIPNPLFLFEWEYRAVTMPMILVLLVAGILTVILRYRGSREQERLQLRWLLFGVLLQGLITILTLWDPPEIERFMIWINSLYILIIPLAVGIAVLRYRLYDIDLIIRRTLQYGLLTFSLGLVYFGVVTVLQQVFTTMIGTQSPLAVVLSTLLIFFLFTPLRRRLQAFIDRRFFRRRYNSEQVLRNFVERTRAQANLTEISDQLLATVTEAVEPQGIHLWLPAARFRSPAPGYRLDKEQS